MTSNVNSQPNLDEIRELLSPYLDGEVSEEERLQVEQAIGVSDELRQELETLRQTVNLLAALPSVPAPRPFTLSEADIQPLVPASKKRFSWFSGWTGSLAMAAVAILCVLVAGGIFFAAQFDQAAAPQEIASYAEESAAAPATAPVAQEAEAAEEKAESAAREEVAAAAAEPEVEKEVAAEAEMAQEEAAAADEPLAQQEMAAEAVEEAVEAQEAPAPEGGVGITSNQETTESLVAPTPTASPALVVPSIQATTLPPAPPQPAEAGEAVAAEAAPALKSAPAEEEEEAAPAEDAPTTLSIPAEEEADLAQDQAYSPDQVTATPTPVPTATSTPLPLPTPTVALTLEPFVQPTQPTASPGLPGWLVPAGVVVFSLAILLIIGFIIWKNSRRA